MTNLNDREAYNRENYPNSDNRDLSGQVTGSNETNLPGTAPRQPAYRDGYIHGRDIEQRRYEADQEVRDNDNAARGLLLGILLTGAVGLATAAYFLSQRNDPNPAPATQTIVVPKTSPAPQQSPQVRERVIERDRVVPVPQQQAPATAPDVNITVPSPAPQAPASQSAPTQSAPTQASPQSSTPDTTTQQAAPAQTSPSTSEGTSGSASDGTTTDGTTTQPSTSPTGGSGQ